MPDKKFRRTHFPERLLVVPLHVKEQRENACKECPYYKSNAGTCQVSGRFIASLLTHKGTSCPMGQWSTWYGD